MFSYRNADNFSYRNASLKTPVEIKVSNTTIMSEEKVKLLGIYIDNRPNFDY